MDAEARVAIERELTRKIASVRIKLGLLPSHAWGEEKTRRKRDHLAAQLRELEAQLMRMRQIPLFPLNHRRGG